MTNHHY